MGNRLSRKKQRASAAGIAPVQEAVVAPSFALPAQPESEIVARKDEVPAQKNEVELPLSARQVPPTARDDGNNEDNPLEFFRQCYELEEDPFTLYTQALLLKDQREFAAAGELLRALLSNASLSFDARYHLAQCLVARDPELRSCCEEVTKCLEDVVAATKASFRSADAHQAAMFRESLELLAHVMIAGRRFDRALELLDELQVEMDTDAAASPNQAMHRQQQTLISFQRSFCRYACGESPEAISSELLRVLPQQPEPNQEQQTEDQQAPNVSDPFEGIELLLHADAASLREGLALLAATST